MSRINEVIMAAESAGPDNPAGWIRQCLAENWDVSRYVAEAQAARKAEEERRRRTEYYRELERRTREKLAQEVVGT
ncbi:MAG TPA: hypothetical protein G4O02_06765 [Caldilineae bacterium]|nr:hypothetical protein [Caldilineae bacterium]